MCPQRLGIVHEDSGRSSAAPNTASTNARSAAFLASSGRRLRCSGPSGVRAVRRSSWIVMERSSACRSRLARCFHARQQAAVTVPTAPSGTAELRRWRHRRRHPVCWGCGVGVCADLSHLSHEQSDQVEHVHGLLDDLATGECSLDPPRHRRYPVQPGADSQPNRAIFEQLARAPLPRSTASDGQRR